MRGRGRLLLLNFQVTLSAAAFVHACASFSGGAEDTDGGLADHDASPETQLPTGPANCDDSASFSTTRLLIGEFVSQTDAFEFGDQLFFVADLDYADGRGLQLQHERLLADGGRTDRGDADIDVPRTNIRSPSLLSDGITLHYLAQDPDGGEYKPYRATRPSTTSFNFAGVQIGTESLLSLNVNEQAMWYARSVDGGMADGAAATALFRAPLDGGAFPTSASRVFAEQVDARHAVSTKGEARVYFGAFGERGLDIWTATSVDAGAAIFSKPTLVTELNSDSDEYPAWVSADGCRIIIARTFNSLGWTKLYAAQKPSR